jgi:hypothetical protein
MATKPLLVKLPPLSPYYDNNCLGLKIHEAQQYSRELDQHQYLKDAATNVASP